jgi:hypothetical protein
MRAYFGNLTLGREVLLRRKVTHVAGGHTQQGYEGRLQLRALVPPGTGRARGRPSGRTAKPCPRAPRPSAAAPSPPHGSPAGAAGGRRCRRRPAPARPPAGARAPLVVPRRRPPGPCPRVAVARPLKFYNTRSRVTASVPREYLGIRVSPNGAVLSSGILTLERVPARATGGTAGRGSSSGWSSRHRMA